MSSPPPSAARKARAAKRRAPEPTEAEASPSPGGADAATEPSARPTQRSARRKQGGTEAADSPRNASPARSASPAPVGGALTDPLGVLPSDLVSLVLGFIPLRARMVSVSLVCKRWRAAVLRSVRAFRPWRRLFSPTYYTQPDRAAADAALAGLAQLFPSLTDLALIVKTTSGEATLRLPATLRTLRADVAYFTVHFAPPLPALTSLHADIRSKDDACPLAALLAASATSLTSLELSGPRKNSVSVLECTRFPSLTSAAITFTEPTTTALLSFLQAHASQLLSLTLRSSRGVSFEVPRLPQLTELCVWEVQQFEASDALGGLLAQCPQLASLTLSNPTAARAIPPEYRTALRCLHLEVRSDPPPLDQFPNLARLGHLDSFVDPLIRVLPNRTYATVLRSLELRYNKSVSQDALMLAMCTNLEALTLVEYPEPYVRLPLLEVLDLPYDHRPVSSLLRCLRAFIRRSPRLRSLSFTLPNKMSEEELDGVRKFVDELRRTGVEDVTIECERSIEVEEAITKLLCTRVDGWLDVRIKVKVE